VAWCCLGFDARPRRGPVLTLGGAAVSAWLTSGQQAASATPWPNWGWAARPAVWPTDGRARDQCAAAENEWTRKSSRAPPVLEISNP
jgi:hypothetical protein